MTPGSSKPKRWRSFFFRTTQDKIIHIHLRIQRPLLRIIGLIENKSVLQGFCNLYPLKSFVCDMTWCIIFTAKDSTDLGEVDWSQKDPNRQPSNWPTNHHWSWRLVCSSVHETVYALISLKWKVGSKWMYSVRDAIKFQAVYIQGDRTSGFFNQKFVIWSFFCG